MWMGHSSFETTQRYVDKFDAVELARLMRPSAPTVRPQGDEMVGNPWLQQGKVVGDTGFEPVTSTV